MANQFKLSVPGLLSLVLMVSALSATAQVAAPTLSAGLTAVTGQRGDLDIELLSEIISQKQDEVKREILQRKILKSMDGQSFALQNFVYSSFHALLTYKDKKAIEKELLTQASILALQVGFAEVILQLSFRVDSSSASHELKTGMIEYIKNNYDVKGDTVDICYNNLDTALNEERFMLLFSLDNLLDQIVSDVTDKCKQNPKKCRRDPQKNFASVLLDVIFEATRKNKVLENQGFVQLHPNLQPAYEEMNQYIWLLKQNPGRIDSLGRFVDVGLDLLVTYHPLMHDFINDFDLTIKTLLAASTDLPLLTNLANQIEKVSSYVDLVSARMGLLSLENGIDQETVARVSTMLGEVRSGLADYYARGVSITDTSIADYAFMRHTVQPLVNELIALGILKSAEVKNIDDISMAMYRALLTRLVNTINRDSVSIGALLKTKIQEYGPLIKIITSLSHLDDVKSYEHIFNALTQIGISKTENSESRFVKDLVYYLEAYTSFNRDSNLLNVEVEPLLLKLLTLYESRASGDVQLYFGTGLNQTYRVNYADGVMPLTDSDGEEINSLSFASEKIGMKFKLINNKRIQSQHESELKWCGQKWIHANTRHRNQKPVVSDLYLFGYGSGLLYNVANLTTAGENFDYAMAGFGIGIAFFNSLDLSIWRASPIVGDDGFGGSLENRGFYGFSFDIKLTEYLSALGEKRAQMKLAESMN